MPRGAPHPADRRRPRGAGRLRLGRVDRGLVQRLLNGLRGEGREGAEASERGRRRRCVGSTARSANRTRKRRNPRWRAGSKPGKAACRGKTPAAVKKKFYAEAEEYLEPQQAEMIGQLAKFEAREKTDESFIAGQLAADVYAATLEAEEAPAGYQGCIYSLARSLEQRLAPKKKK